jgi:hypothetical protein
MCCFHDVIAFLRERASKKSRLSSKTHPRNWNGMANRGFTFAGGHFTRMDDGSGLDEFYRSRHQL